MAANQHSTADGTRFVSEMFVPIRQDSKSFDERQGSVWDEMHSRMDQRRKEWNDQVSHMRKDFFRLRPEDVSPGGGHGNNAHSGRPGNVGSGSSELSNMFCIGPDGKKLFRVSFDVNQFEPSEINVHTEDHRLIIHAKHEQKGQAKTVSREFSRQVDIPQNVDPQSLRSTLSSDGVLQVEGLVLGTASYALPARDGSTGLHYRLCTPTPPEAAATAATTTSCTPSSAVSETDGSQIFRISVDIGAEFEPSDLAVKTVDKKLFVHARHEEKAPGRTSCREFKREFDLPDAVDPMTVTAGMSSEGRLIIKAPLTSYTQGTYSGRPGSVKQPTITVSFQPNSAH